MSRPMPALLLLLSISGCQEYGLQGKDGTEDPVEDNDSGIETIDESDIPEACRASEWPAEEVGIGDACVDAPEGGFQPVVKWHWGANRGCLSLPVVADLDGDGQPEIILNALNGRFAGLEPGNLVVVDGATGALRWEASSARVAFGSPPAVADLDDDGIPEIITVRQYASSLLATGDFTLVAWSASGTELWESAHFIGLDFDYATSPSISDMDHDGLPEIVAGRVILNADGSTRGVGQHGRGSYGIVTLGTLVVAETSVSAIADLDLDGQEEVIVGNAIYDVNGNTTWNDVFYDDGMIGIANLDADPEGEFIAISYNTIRAHDTHGAVLWGPIEVATANILSTPAIADLDGDGMPEIVVAGGNQLVVFNHDGSQLWSAAVTDESGATGASIFDFEGDGVPEVVYIDEIEMIAYDGATGAVKFYSTEHASNTMFDYPVVADIDSDDHAEILVCHNGYGQALTAYQDQNDSWASARPVWNQHAYTISNINDDLSVPVTATPGFSHTNTWHSAIATTGEELLYDLSGEITEVCLDDCDEGRVFVTARAWNISDIELSTGTNLALYARHGSASTLLQTVGLTDAIAAGWSTDGIVFTVSAPALEGADDLYLSIDDDGSRVGLLAECSESNNHFVWEGPFCE